MKAETKFRDYFVHEKAICDSPNIGAGTRIWAYSHVMERASVGRECNLGENVFVESGAVIGNGCTVKNGVAIWEGISLEDWVFVGPYAVFTNDLRPRAFIKRNSEHLLPTLICYGATIGANATIVCGVTVGEFAMIGAGSVVTKDVPPQTLVIGNPARAVGGICYCGEGLDTNDFCRACSLQLSKNPLRRRSFPVTRGSDHET